MPNQLEIASKTSAPLAKPITTVGDQFLVRLMTEIGGLLTPAKLAAHQSKVNEWIDCLEAVKTSLRDRILAVLKASGTDMQLEEDGWTLSARPWRTGYDGKKVEALLRAKKVDVSKWMDQEVTYNLNEQKLGAAIQAGILSQQELDTSCKAGLDKNGEQIWAVQLPKRS